MIAVAAPLGDLFESMLKRDMEVKDTGSCSAATAACSTGSTRSLFASVAAFYVILALDVGHTVPVKRIALLGATGSIGRQAIEIIEPTRSSSSSPPRPARRPIDGARRRR